MKCFITGIGGFVGPYLAEHLIDQGHEVSGSDLVKKDIENVEVFEGDVTDKQSMEEVISKVKPDIIFHLAGQSSVEKSFEEPELTHNINVEGTRNLLDAVIAAKIKPKIVVVSSSEVYGKQEDLPIKETATPNPKSPYAESRINQEKLAKRYQIEKGMHIIISRSFNHTGPGQSPVFVCPDFAKQIAEIETGKANVIKTGNLEVSRDFSDVNDVVKAYLLLAEKGKPGETYNVCSGNAYKIGEVLATLLSFSNKEIKVEQDPGKTKKEDSSIFGDNSKVKQEIGWQPEISFDQTLKDILEYWRKNV